MEDDYFVFIHFSLSLSGPSTNQALSKHTESSSSLTDIKIENFDVAFGGHVLLSDAELSMAFGRRYGLVGRNGNGR